MCEPFTCVSELIVTCCLPLVEFSEGVCIRPVADFQYLSISIPVLAARDVEANRVECGSHIMCSSHLALSHAIRQAYALVHSITA